VAVALHWPLAGYSEAGGPPPAGVPGAGSIVAGQAGTEKSVLFSATAGEWSTEEAPQWTPVRLPLPDEFLFQQVGPVAQVRFPGLGENGPQRAEESVA
jgi:hypothetical protein